MVGDLLPHFQLAAVLQIGRNPGRTEGVIANRCRPLSSAANDAVGILLEEGIGCQLAGLAVGGAEKIAVGVGNSNQNAFDSDLLSDVLGRLSVSDNGTGLRSERSREPGR